MHRQLGKSDAQFFWQFLAQIQYSKAQGGFFGWVDLLKYQAVWSFPFQKHLISRLLKPSPHTLNT